MLSAELLVVALNAILFHRQIYQRSSFARARKWGAPIMVCNEPEVKLYIKKLVSSIRKEWLDAQRPMLQVAMIILDTESEPIERWQFGFRENNTKAAADELKLECQAVIRQIAATTTFLPVIRACTFRVAVSEPEFSEQAGYKEIPEGWLKAEPRDVKNKVEGQLQEVHAEHIISPEVVYRFQ